MREHSGLVLRVYSGIPRQDAGEEWLNNGLVFPHHDGKGFDLVLQALPLNPKLVVRDTSQDPVAGVAELSEPKAVHERRGPPSLKHQFAAFERAVIERSLLETD